MNSQKYIFLFAGATAIGFFFVGYRLVFSPEQATPEPAQKIVNVKESETISQSNTLEKAPEAPLSTEDEEKPAVEQLKALANSKKPEDVFQAYNILASCFHIEGDLRSLNSTPLDENDSSRKAAIARNQRAQKLCQGVSYSEMAHRLDLLDIAIKAKVPGAAILFCLEGPFGDADALQTRPNDPAILAWKKKAVAQLEAAAEAGERDTFIFLITLFSEGQLIEKDPVKVYTYTIAHHAVQELESNAQPFSKKYLSVLEKGLTPTQVAQAQEKAKALVQACCTSSAK